MTLATRFKLLRWRVDDNFRHSAFVRFVVVWLHWLRGRCTGNPGTRARQFAKAFGLAEKAGEVSFLYGQLRPLLSHGNGAVWRGLVVENARYDAVLRERSQLTRSVVLKAPLAGGEKGVLLNYFEYNLARVLALSDDDLEWLADRFHLVFLASWSPTDYALLASALLRWPVPVFVQCANEREREKLVGFHPRLVCLPGLACDWVDPSFYEPKPHSDRSIDLLMVANWGSFKRHWEFFEALTKLPANLRVVLVGQREGGRDMKFIERMAAEIGVPQNLEFHESLSIEEVTALQCDSRVSIILSRREGGCVAAVESLFAGCALAMREDARIGSAAHIHEDTGLALRPGRVAEDLSRLVEIAGSLNPREWAVEQIRNDLTLSRINAVIRDTVLGAGETWTVDLAVPRWRPHPTLAKEADRERLRSIYAELHQRLPGLVSADLMDMSHF